jgi:choline dehydrogenase-like flavoprotein
MNFSSLTYDRFVSTHSTSQSRLFSQYFGSKNDFDIIIIGSGIGGGVLADDLADRLGKQKRILVVEAGSYLYPTHVYNVCRFPNSDVARRFACRTFFQKGNQGSQHYIHEEPQLNFGGRSIFWSGLIPIIQPWELEFFPSQVRGALASGLLTEAGAKMNESVTMGTTAQAIVNKLRQSSLVQDFSIQETPRALHQPYLTREGLPSNRFFIEPTGVFNTAELLINQVDIAPGGSNLDAPGLRLLLNHFVEGVKNAPGNRLEVVTRSTLNGQTRNFEAKTVVLAAGSIESPKLLQRSNLFSSLPNQVQTLAGVGLTDHPTTHPIETFVTNIGNVPISRDSHAKIIFYSRGLRDAQNQIRYPFNVEMNINHEYWHLREIDPSSSDLDNDPGASRLDIKFSFGNCLDTGNRVKLTAPADYVPEIEFRNMNWIDHLAAERLPALAGWNKSFDEIFAVLNDITYRIFSQFQINGQEPRPVDEAWNGQKGKGFGFGTVHHAVGTLRMPHRPTYTAAFQPDSVVDENLKVIGTQNLYVCDMSVMPFSAAANPVRTLVALALRLSRHLG